MDIFVINGGSRLKGTVRVGGSKNACLPIMAATRLTDGPTTLTDAPTLADTRHMPSCWAIWACRSRATPKA